MLYEGEIERGRENLRMIMDQNKEVNRWKDFSDKEGKGEEFVLSCFYLFVFVGSVEYLDMND